MPTNTHTDLFDDRSPCLREDQLAAYNDGRLTERERYRVQRHLESCTLCTAAIAGFAAVPAGFSDIPLLRKTISTHSGAATSAKTWLIGSLAVVGIIAIAMLAWPKKEHTPLLAPVVAPKKDSVVPVQLVQVERFIRPGAKVEQMKKTAQSPTVIDTAKPIIAPREIPALLPITTTLTVTTTTTTPTIDETPKLVYNAPVYYILDLKITEFDKYYRKPIEIKTDNLSGTPAPLETWRSSGSTIIVNDDMVRTVAADKLLKEALTYFNQARFGKCISSFQLLLDHNAEDLNANFYTGVSYVRLELYSNAIPFLDKVINDKNNIFHEEAKWYKAQALIGKGDAASAKTLLQQIVDEKGFYAQQAKDKLATLK